MKKKILIASVAAALACAVPALAGGPLGVGASAGVGVNAGAHVGRNTGLKTGVNLDADADVTSEGRQTSATEMEKAEIRAHERSTSAPVRKRFQSRPAAPQAGASAVGNWTTEAEAGKR